MRGFIRFYFLAALVAGWLAPHLIYAQGVPDALDRPAQQTPRAAHSVLLDITSAGSRLVAVGERGIVVLADDGGRTWRQAKVPTSESLTAVAFSSPKVGWAVGHSGIVIHTEDGGEDWTRQLDGRQAAQLALDGAQAYASQHPNSEPAKQLLTDAQRLVADGPDKPFLSLYFENDQAGFIAGAYGLIFRTEDGGKTWKSWMDRLNNPKGLHIYAIKSVGNLIYLAGEQGLFLRSTDEGATFTRIETPYKGTYFTIALSTSGDVVLAGMQGNAYRSSDQGKTFTKIDVLIPASFSAVATLNDGTMVFVNQAGQVLTSHDRGRTLQLVPMAPLPLPAAILPLNDGLVLSAGVAGVIPFQLSGSNATSAGGAP